jgi:hypothetical protein
LCLFGGGNYNCGCFVIGIASLCYFGGGGGNCGGFVVIVVVAKRPLYSFGCGLASFLLVSLWYGEYGEYNTNCNGLRRACAEHAMCVQVEYISLRFSG